MSPSGATRGLRGVSSQALGLAWGVLLVGHVHNGSPGTYLEAPLNECSVMELLLWSLHSSLGEACFSSSYMWSHSFCHYFKLTAAGEGWNVDQLVNWELCLSAKLSLHTRPVQHVTFCPAPPINKTQRSLKDTPGKSFQTEDPDLGDGGANSLSSCFELGC